MDEFIFAEESKQQDPLVKKPWKILISDDEKEIHTITKIVLSNFIYEGRKVEILDAYSRRETIDILKQHNDIAVLLLDVVMDTDDAGLLVARDIRETLKNNLIRIILRTGQPGSAPEKDVIYRYDINDYKEKTELTTTKLFTTIMTGLRSYRDLYQIEKNKKGLEQILLSTNNIMKIKKSHLFVDSVLKELNNLLLIENDVPHIDNEIDGLIITKVPEEPCFISGKSGIFKNSLQCDLLNNEIKNRIYKCIDDQSSYYNENYHVGYFKNDNNVVNVIYLQSEYFRLKSDCRLIDIFSNNIAVAFNNVQLASEILDTQKEIIQTLSEVVEKRSKETSNHVLRVAKVSEFLALQCGLSEAEASKIFMASPLHDIGKTGIPDSILLKPGKLTAEEYEVMKEHATIGRDILGSSRRPILKAASIIAYEHHEKWNGKGYPNNKKGEEIHIYGRITALADVFDALYHKRCYKDAWPLEEIMELINREKGEHFDPNLVDIFNREIDSILKIIEELR